MHKRFLAPTPPDEGEVGGAPLRRLGWFAAIAAASAGVVITTAYVLRAFLFLG